MAEKMRKTCGELVGSGKDTKTRRIIRRWERCGRRAENLWMAGKMRRCRECVD